MEFGQFLSFKAMLAIVVKQAVVRRIYKAGYYPKDSVLASNLGYSPTFVWGCNCKANYVCRCNCDNLKIPPKICNLIWWAVYLPA